MPDANVVVATYLTACGISACGWVLFAGQSRNHWTDRALAWQVWHWATGGRLEPRRTFVDLDDPRPPWKRWARRALIGVARTMPVVLIVGPELTTMLAGGTWLVVYAAMRFAHYRQWIRSLHRSVHKLAGWPETKRPSSYILVTRNREHAEPSWWRRRLPDRWKLRGTGIVVKVAPDFDWKQKRQDQLVATVKQKLDLEGVSMTPVPAGRHGYFQWRPEKPMPLTARFSDPAICRLVDDAKTSAPVIGISRSGAVAVDLDTESPHILLSAGTGGGKSSTIRTLAAQLMVSGADVTILDIKRHSHQWARGLPGVRYARDLGDIHHVIVELGQEGHRRNRAWDDVDLDDRGPVFRRHVIVCEEMNATTTLLQEWWKNHRESGDPPTSPAVRSLNQILYMGRAVRIHVLAVAQMATAQSMGGGAARENFPTRILARYTGNNAKMLVPECNLPPATRHPGRAQVCIGGIATETQLLYMTDHEARAYVLDGATPALDVAGRSTPVPLGKQPVTVTSVASAEPAAVGPPPVTLRHASSDLGVGIVMLRYDALRKAIERSRRNGEAPSPVGRDGPADLWDPLALQRWELNTPRGRRTATVIEPTSEDVGDVRMEEQKG